MCCFEHAVYHSRLYAPDGQTFAADPVRSQMIELQSCFSITCNRSSSTLQSAPCNQQCIYIQVSRNPRALPHYVEFSSSRSRLRDRFDEKVLSSNGCVCRDYCKVMSQFDKMFAADTWRMRSARIDVRRILRRSFFGTAALSIMSRIALCLRQQSNSSLCIFSPWNVWPDGHTRSRV
jgi:hypothetical protein